MNMPTMTIPELVDDIMTVIPLGARLYPGEVADLLILRRHIHAFANYLWYTATDEASRAQAMTVVLLSVGPTNEVCNAPTH